MTDLVKASDYGLDEKQGTELTKDLIQILNEREILSQRYSEVIKMEITVANIPTFKELRLKIRDNRTKGIEVWHKANKAFFLQGGKFVDAIKNKASSENERMEANLLSNENYFENLEKARIEKLQADRTKLLLPYQMDIIPTNLGNMKEEDWGFFLAGVKSSYEQKKAAEKKAEEERLEKERKAGLYRDRKDILIPYWNHLKEDHKSVDFGELSANDFNIILIEVKKTKEVYDKDQEKTKKENDRLKKEKEEREANDKAAQQAEKAKIQAELKKGDSEKLQDLLNDLQHLKMKYLFKAEKNQAMFENVRGLLDKVIDYIENNTK